MGQALAVLLGKAGHRVAAFERFHDLYRLPRAVHLDHEVMRIVQSLDVAGALAGELLPLHEYRWLGADGEPLLTLVGAVPTPSGWDPDYLFHQPALESALEDRIRLLGSVTVERGCAVEAIEAAADGVLRQVRTGEGERTVAARWVIGADGANSLVREGVGIGRRDLGFRERWFVVDVEPRDMTALDLPRACQWCDPARPTTHVQSGTGHRRWEFMLLPDEDPGQFGEARAWELLAPWFGPQDGWLVRHAVYEFRSMLAERMRHGRVLLAGDAAHLTPPFLGQGLCAGLRDAANIAWKLDLVLRGVAGPALLDTVEVERQPQNEWIIEFAIQLGRVLCELDPVKAAERDVLLRATKAPSAADLPTLASGVVREGDAVAGRLGVQATVAMGGREGRLDDLTGGGFTLLARWGDPLAALAPEQRDFLAALGVRVVSLDRAEDLDGRATAFLDEHVLHAVLTRPDFYVFGGAGAPEELPVLIDDLRAQIPTPEGAFR